MVTIDGTTGTIRATNGIFSGHVSASAFYTSGSHLTQAYSTSDSPNTVLHLLDTSDFSSSGSGYIIDSSNNLDYFNWTGKTSTTFTGCSGLLDHNSGAVVVANESIVISYATNELYFFGDRGDGTVAYLGRIGGSTGSTSNGYFGSIFNNNYGLRSYTGGGYGILGSAQSGNAIWGSSVSGYGIIAQTASGPSPLRIVASASASAPSHSANLGSLWVTSAGVLYINTNGSTTWAKVGAQ